MIQNRIVAQGLAGAAPLAVLALALAGFAGCEPSPEPEVQQEEAPPAAPEAREPQIAPDTGARPVSLEQQTIAIQITPTALQVSPNTASPGPAVIYVTNRAGVPYDVSFEGPGLDSDADDLQPGETRQFSTTLQVGTYEIEVSAERGPERERQVLLTVRP